MTRFRPTRLAVGIMAALVCGVSAAGDSAAQVPAAKLPTLGKQVAVNFQVVGHDPLYRRGENAALAVSGDYAYVGSRTDSAPDHLHPGVLVVNVHDPAHPRVVHEITAASVDPKLALGYTSRELRVWPQQHVLMVLYFGCSAIIHSCLSASDTGEQPFQQLDFFDIAGANAGAPRLVSTYKPSTTPHEMFLWVDPVRAGRALLYWTSPNNSVESLVVTDLSSWRSARFDEIATFTALAGYTLAEINAYDVRLHSLSVRPDGTQGYLAYLGGGVLVVDTSDFANAVANPQVRLVTPVANRAYWDYEGAHSAVKVPGRPYLFTTEEIYGKGRPYGLAFGPAFGGCPWGWVRLIDISDPTHPHIASQFKIAENRLTCRKVPAPQENYSSYASHNPTVLGDLALLTWHSGGLRAIDLADPTHPVEAGRLLPTPEPFSVTPDPALEPGSNGVIAWSYPVIQNGLIYYVDIRNGLYIVRYTGAHAAEVAGIQFLEGNSNLGDAARLEAGH